MLTIEEYISKRKKEDNLNEFDIDKKVENIKLGPGGVQVNSLLYS